MGTFWLDLRYGLRMYARSPGFTAVAVLTLALGIGANTAIFSLVNGILLRPLPYSHADQIVHVSWQGQGYVDRDLNVPAFEFCRDHGQAFAAIAAIRGFEDRELKYGTSTQWIKALAISDGFFETLGVNPSLGQSFSRDYTRPQGPSAVVLTNSLWRRVYGADPTIIGRSIVLDDRAYTVTGVLPPDFQFAYPADLFVSLSLGSTIADAGANTDVIGRLRAGVTLSQAEAEMPLLGHQFWAQTSGLQRENQSHYHLERYQSWLASGYRMSVLMLLAAVGLLLLIACANVASLLLARANARQRQTSIRLALGASPGRLFAQFLAEGLCLGISGGVAGFAGAFGLLRVATSAIPWELPAVDRIGLDGRVFLFTLLIGTIASIGFGLSSFAHTRRVDLNSTLTDGRAVVGIGRAAGRFLSGLVVGEIAVSLTLALGAGLLIQSLYNLSQETLGFDPAHLVLMATPFAKGLDTTGAATWGFERQVLERIEAIPGVQSAAAVSVAPLHGQNNLPAQRDGHPEHSTGGTEYRAVSPTYFSTMGISVLRGRGFEKSDFASAVPVAVINETLARDWWKDASPIGDRLVVGEFQGQKIPDILEPARTIVGVAADVKGMTLSRPAPPMVYVPASEAITTGSTDWVVRTSSGVGIATALQRAVTEIAPDQRVVDIEPMTQLVSASVAQPSFEAMLMSAFGGLALFLTLVGVYGVLSFQVRRRTHEIGVRLALGASRGDITRLIVGSAAKLATIGVIIGLAAALGVTRLIASLLYRVQPADPTIFAAVAIVVLAVAMLAAYLPARRAMRVDPLIALRSE